MSQSKHPYADILIAIANGEQFVHVHNYPVSSEHILDAISRNDFDSCSVKIKPKTIMINGHEVPEPLSNKDLMEENRIYYVASLSSDELIIRISWVHNSTPHNTAFVRGLFHLTEEAAIKHAEALLSFTKVKE